jgi:glycosyltransferase involved in cell wall biosynthesis
MTPTPFLTIAIPTWRRAAALERQLALVLGGLPHADVEVLVGDNGSDDATPEVIAASAARDGRVRSYRNPVNLGCDANYLRLIEWARGEWIWLLGDDEPLDPAGQLGAWWTLHRAFPAAQRPEVDRREARDRLPETLRALQHAAEQGTEPLDPDELAMLVLLVPPEQRAGVQAFCQGVLAVAAQRRGAAGETAAY